MYYLPYSTYLPTSQEGGGGRGGEWRKIKRSRQQKQQTTTTTSTSTSRYLLPFLRITVSVAWYIYLTVLKCICNVGLKKNHQSINKLLYHTWYPPPTCTFTNTLTSPYLTLHSVLTLSIPPQQHLPIPDTHTHTLSVTISGLSPPTYLPTHLHTLPYPSILGIHVLSCFSFSSACLALFTSIHTYFPFYQPSLPLGR